LKEKSKKMNRAPTKLSEQKKGLHAERKSPLNASGMKRQRE